MLHQATAATTTAATADANAATIDATMVELRPLQRFATSSHQDYMEATPSAPTNSYRTSRSRRGSTRLRERGWLRLDR